jgi:DNA-binding LacI/PurR family transcriptional regulator
VTAATGASHRPQNIAELAKLAGVTPGTVSKALSGRGTLAEGTRERIRKLAADLGFEPSSMARNLRMGRSGAIGVIVPLGHERTQHLSDPFFMTLLGHIADSLVEHEYDLLLSRVIPAEPNWLGRILQSGRIDGAIVIGQSDQNVALNRAARAHSNMVVWGAHLSDQLYCTVGTDNRAGGRIATDHLLARGCRRLAFFGDPAAPEVAQRLDGFQGALAAAGDGPQGELVPVHFTPEIAGGTIAAFLDKGDAVDGIFAASDVIGMMTLQALAERGRSVPGEVKVIGFDDLEVARHTVPPLSSIRQDLQAAAASLVDLLFKRMNGEDAGSVVLEPELVLRSSTAA